MRIIPVLLSAICLLAAALGDDDAAKPPANAAGPFPVLSPPPELKADPFYTKYVDADGYPIVASAGVNDYALKEAAFLVGRMLAHRPDVKRAMVAGGSRMLILAYNEFTTDLPEYAHMEPKDYWDARARGLGGSETDPYCSCAEENLLGYPDDPYAAECILIHEFAHNIHLRGMVKVDPTFDTRLQAAYGRAMSQGLWKGKYASVNHHEYFAEGVQSWFDNNRPPDHDHNFVDTRKELVAYDPGLAELCREVFGDTKLVYTKPATRLEGHLAGYDPKAAPTFRWPDRLAEVKAKIKREAVARNEAAQALQPDAAGPSAEIRLPWADAASGECPASEVSSQPTVVFVVNRGSRAVTIDWVDPQGHRKPYGSIPAHEDRRQPTYQGHAWLVTDEKGTPLGHFVAGAKAAVVVIPERE